jgi:hypothetical protein
MDLVYKWINGKNQLGDKITIALNHGDIYMMSSKAVKSKNKFKNVLLHAAGCNKYT